jgi:hypothetical protein
MSIKDNDQGVDRIGSIPIKSCGLIIPRDKFARFLNADPRDDQAVIEYCANYNLYITNGSRQPGNSQVQAFRRFQTQIKNIIKRAKEDKLTIGDLNRINKKLKHLYPQLIDVSVKKLNRINLVISNVDKTNNKIIQRKAYAICSDRADGSDIYLWQALAKQIIVEQKLGECPCGKYFIKNRENKKYCDESCKQEFRAKRLYYSKK